MPLSPRTVALMSTKTSEGRRKKVTIAAVVVGLLIVAAVGVGVAVGLNNRNKDSSTSVSATAVDSSGSEAAQLESSEEGTTTDSTTTDSTPTEDAPTADTPAADTPTEDTLTDDTPSADTPTADPPTSDMTEEEALALYYSTGAACPPDGIAWPQWTGRSKAVIGVPSKIQALYAEVEDGNYDATAKTYTLGFSELPADLAYCTQDTITIDSDCKLEKAVTGSLEECGTEEGTEMWTHNNGSKKCQAFTYNGCGGNGNQFASQSLCQLACETPIKATMGGTVTFSKEDDETCSLPPTKAGGSACCTMQLWQPNYAGFYYDNCSVQRELGGDGVYFFKTEMPGNELSAQWGPDPEPHIHYDVQCKDCEENDFFSGEYRYWNKFYPENMCELKSCYSGKSVYAPGPEHKAQLKEMVDGELRYTYSMSLPSQDDEFTLIG